MKVRNKLVIAFIIPILLIGILSLGGFLWSRVLFVNSAEQSTKKLQAIANIKSFDNELTRYAFAYLILLDPEQKKMFDQTVQKEQQLMVDYKKLALTKEEQQSLAQAEKAMQKSIDTETQLFQIAEQRALHIKENHELLNNKIWPLLKDLQNSIKTSDPQYQQKKSALDAVEVSLSKFIVIFKGYILDIQSFSTEQLNSNLTELNQAVEKLKSNNFDSQQLLLLTQLTESINKINAGLNETFSLAKERLDLVKEDDAVTTEVDVTLDKLYKSAHEESEAVLAKIVILDYAIISIILLFIVLGIILSFLFARHLMRPIDHLRRAIKSLRQNKDVTIQRVSNDEIGDLTDAFAQLVKENKSHNAAMTEQNWLKENSTEILKVAQAETSLEKMCNTVITRVAEILNAGYGVFYIAKEDEQNSYLVLLGTYAYTKRKKVSNQFKFGESLVGQAALEGKPILLTDVPSDYVHVTSGLGDKQPACIMVLPIILENKTLGVIEIALLHAMTEIQQQFLEQLALNLGVVIEALQSKQRTEVALKKVQESSEELQAQQEELRTANEELEEKTNVLQQSEEELKTQSEELQTTNEELEEKMHAIEEKNSEIEIKNKELEKSRLEIEEKAKELARAGKYKTEFLSNMSHELRTPLNSLLLLSKSFADNDDGNLTPEQIEQAGIIYKGGKDLLELINDILDLSKVEAGKLNIQIEKVKLVDVLEDLARQFDSVVSAKGLKFEVEKNIKQDWIETDGHRLKQILRNLISNAVKFTQTGYVKLVIDPASDAMPLRNKTLNVANSVAFKVIDTGIGIEESKFQDIFEAFQQAYGDTDRTYGGTGLGLTISRELAKLLGGEIILESKIGQGSTFSLVLPLQAPSINNDNETKMPDTQAVQQPAASMAPSQQASVTADLEIPSKNNITILLIESDPQFLDKLMQISKQKSYQCITAVNAATGLLLAEKQQPDGIIVNLAVPDIDEVHLLQQLKEHNATKDIPVHVIANKDASDLLNAVEYQKKPEKPVEFDRLFNFFTRGSSNKVANILLVEDELVTQTAILKAVKEKPIHITAVMTGKEGLEKLKNTSFDGMILDLRLPDMNGQELLKIASQESINLPPIIIYSQKDLSAEEYAELNQYTNQIVRKEGYSSIERLLNECSLFLHAVDKTQKKLKNNVKKPVAADTVLQNKSLLLVDDDMRNVYALSKVLQHQGMVITVATNGEEALQKMQTMSQLDIVIMDIMMPILDGYETMKRIRQNPQYKELPIIAITAKAMPEDKKACLDAGANDYITKPIDTEKLLAILKIWLSSS